MCLTSTLWTLQAVDSLLSAEFLRSTQFHEQPAVMARIASSLRADGTAPAQRIMAEVAAGAPGEGNELDEELMPLILGLKRTGHLSATVRFMRAAAAQEVKAGIRCASHLALPVVAKCIAPTAFPCPAMVLLVSLPDAKKETTDVNKRWTRNRMHTS